MANSMLPSWVSPPALGGSSMPGTPNGISRSASAPSPQAINPNAWDGLGTNTNANQAPASSQSIMGSGVSNVGQPTNGAGLSLPQNIQQLLQMYNQQNGSGFQGLQQVQGNPFANLGSNIQPWGQSATGGIYGGT
jgi:hypothetical protein